MAPATPYAAASGGMDSAATPIPSGVEVCRMPIARPRSPAPNQPITSRPLAEYTEAPAAPARASRTPRVPMPSAVWATASRTAARPSPAEITTRSP